MQSNATERPKKPSRFLLIALVGGAVLIPLSRLPQILGDQFFPDGDECVLGLMAKHLAAGEQLPVFFYGQKYGFSLLEAGTGALAFLAVEQSPAVLKLAMLCLWSLGWLAMVLAVRR